MYDFCNPYLNGDQMIFPKTLAFLSSMNYFSLHNKLEQLRS